MKKKIILVLILIVLMSVFVSSGEPIIFSETFGTTSYFMNNCHNVGENNRTYINYALALTPAPNISNNWINKWSCLDDRSGTGFELKNESAPLLVNTVSGILLRRGADAGCAGNCEQSLGTIFEDNRILTVESEVSFSCSKWTLPNSFPPYFIFGSSTDEKLILPISEGAGECSKADINTSLCCENFMFNLYGGNVCENSTNAINLNFTFQDVLDNCQDGGSGTINFSIDDVQDIRYFAIQTIGSNGIGIFDDISISMINGTNELPNCNSSIIPKTYQCYNDTTVKFNLDIVCNDFENNEILYSVQQVDLFSRALTLDEKFSKFSVFSQDYFVTNETVYNTNAQAEAWKIGVLSEPAITLGQVSSLNLLVADKGIGEFGFNIPQATTNGTVISFVLAVNNDTVLDVEYWSSLDLLTTLTFNFTTLGNLTVYIDNIIKSNTLQPNFNSNFEHYIVVTVGFANKSLGASYLVETQTGDILVQEFITKSVSNFKSIYFVDKNVYNASKKEIWGIDNILIHGFYLSENPSFSNSYSNISIDSIGAFRYKVYTTDNINLNSGRYNTENLWITTTSCGGAYDYSLDNADYIKFLDGGNVVYKGLCTNANKIFAFGSAFRITSTPIDTCKIFYYIYMVICIIIALSIGTYVQLSLFSPYFTFGVSGMVFFLSQALVYKIFEYGLGVRLSLLTLFAVSMISLFWGAFANKTL